MQMAVCHWVTVRVLLLIGVLVNSEYFTGWFRAGIEGYLMMRYMQIASSSSSWAASSLRKAAGNRRGVQHLWSIQGG